MALLHAGIEQRRRCPHAAANASARIFSSGLQADTDANRYAIQGSLGDTHVAHSKRTGAPPASGWSRENLWKAFHITPRVVKAAEFALPINESKRQWIGRTHS